ncbi:MAG: hypothetical protein LBL52_01865 [Rickettsiales bacterium]|jgi:hypothetical protein|nr:hypothetical protein [Rickettsiales bacterium]
MVRKRDSVNPAQEDAPVYPFSVDAGADLSRKYLAATYSLARFSYAVLGLCIVVVLLGVLGAGNMKSAPYFVKWDEAERRFVAIGSGTDAPETLPEGQYFEEYFAREYIRRMFGISGVLAENDDNWCQCENSSKPGLFDTQARCWLCNFSATPVYSNFASNAKPAFELAAKRGESRRVKILDSHYLSGFADPAPLGLSAYLPIKKPTRFRHSEYRIDFITGGEHLTANIAISSPITNPRYQYRVESASFSFTPRARWRE